MLLLRQSLHHLNIDKEIKQKFSLPGEPPTHYSVVKPDRPVRAEVSTAAGNRPEYGGFDNHFGEGGGQQWRMLEDVSNNPDRYADWFTNVEPLTGRKK